MEKKNEIEKRKEVKQFVKDWMSGHEPDTFVRNKHGVPIYSAGHSSLNLESFFEELILDYQYKLKNDNRVTLSPSTDSSEVSDEDIRSHDKIEGIIIDIANTMYSDLTTDSTYDGTWLDEWIKKYYKNIMSQPSAAPYLRSKLKSQWVSVDENKYKESLYEIDTLLNGKDAHLTKPMDVLLKIGTVINKLKS